MTVKQKPVGNIVKLSAYMTTTAPQFPRVT